MLLCEFLQNFDGVVGRAVVGDDDLPFAWVILRDDAGDRFVDEQLVVIRDNYDADQRVVERRQRSTDRLLAVHQNCVRGAEGTRTE